MSLAWQTAASVEIVRLVWLPFFSCFIFFCSYSCWLGLTLPNITVRKTSLSSLALDSLLLPHSQGFPGGSAVKNLPANSGNTGGMGLIPGSGRSPGVRSGKALQYSCLGNPMDRGAWRAAVRGVTESQTRLSTPRTTLVFLATKRVGLPHTLRVPSVPGGHLLVVTQFTSVLTQSTSGYRWIPPGKGPVS